MRSDTQADETFVPLHIAATKNGVPVAWLKAEAEAKRVPFLKAGKRFLFNCDSLKRALLERADATTCAEVVNA
jgi:hypothetical protein